jgi:hypothetical protein
MMLDRRLTFLRLQADQKKISTGWLMHAGLRHAFNIFCLEIFCPVIKSDGVAFFTKLPQKIAPNLLKKIFWFSKLWGGSVG